MLVSVNAARAHKLTEEQMSLLDKYSIYRIHRREGREKFIKNLKKQIALNEAIKVPADAPEHWHERNRAAAAIDTSETELKLAEAGAPESKILEIWLDGKEKYAALFHGKRPPSQAKAVAKLAEERAQYRQRIEKLKQLEAEFGIVGGNSEKKNKPAVKPKRTSQKEDAKPVGKLKRTPQKLAAAVKASPAIAAKIKKIDTDLKTLRKELILAYRKRLKDKGKK